MRLVETCNALGGLFDDQMARHEAIKFINNPFIARLAVSCTIDFVAFKKVSCCPHVVLEGPLTKFGPLFCSLVAAEHETTRVTFVRTIAENSIILYITKARADIWDGAVPS